jgi:hypothetical protein
MSLIDAAFSGYRSGAGRNPRIHKVDYALANGWAGLFAGLGAALLALVAALVYVHSGSRAGQPLAEVVVRLDAAAKPLVHAYGLFATGLLLVILFWTYPRRRTRELAVVLILGPGTLLRPYWIIGGALWALAGETLSMAALIALVVVLQLGVEPGLNMWQERAQRRRLQRW